MRPTLALVVALLLLGTGCGGSDESESGAPPPEPAAAGLNDLDGVDDFARAFDRDAGRARLVLLLAPT